MKNFTHQFLIVLAVIAFLPLTAQEMAMAVSKPMSVKKDIEHSNDSMIPLLKALQTLSQKHQVFFTYEAESIIGHFVRKNSIEGKELEVAIKEALNGTNLDYKKVGQKNYVIFKDRIEKNAKRKAVEKSSSSKGALPKKDVQKEMWTISPLPDNGLGYVKPIEFTVSGSVTDDAGEPLIGVNITLVGDGTTGTISDIDGTYQLTIPDGNQTLLFSYVGYEDQEVAVNGQAQLNVIMRNSASLLDEVVVVGYGTQLKRDVIGSVSTVKAKDLQSFNTSSLDQQLQGLASGVQVNASSGVPGAPVRVLVRGTNSIFSGTEPLWIIDGMILSNQGGGEIGGFSRNASTTGFNPLSTLNPNDIESIEVLKDAAATAVYGSRGANGVIIVTTKTGQQGRGSLDLSVNYGVTDVVRGPNEIGLVDGTTWLALADESRLNRGLVEFDPNSILDVNRDPNAFLDRSQIANTNWADEALRQGEILDINLSTSRGGEKLSYYVSGNYRNEESILTSDFQERYSIRTNLDYDPIENLTLSTRINLSYVDRERAPNGGAPGGNSDIARAGYNQANSGAIPILPIFHPTAKAPDGGPVIFDPRSGRNLRATLDRNNYINDVETYRALAGVQAEYRFPFLKGFAIRTEFAYDLIQTNNIEWASAGLRGDAANNIAQNGKYGFDFSSTFNRTNYNLFAKYERNYGRMHGINLVFGVESTEQNTRSRNIEAQQLFGNAQEIGTAGDPLRISAGFGGEQYFRGYFGRLNYKLLDRYLVGISYRRDGSSIFTEDFRWGDFLAVSAGWVISDESFLKDIDAISFLKLRGSFGQTGNSAISTQATNTTYATWGRYGDVGAGDLLTNIGNQSVTWETTDTWDVGVQFELFEGRVSGNVSYYVQDVTDMLFQVPVPSSSGIFSSSPTIWDNIGDMENKGWEFELSTVNIDAGGFQWRTGFNFATNENQVTRLVEEGDEIATNNNPLVTRVGNRVGFFRLAKFAGIHPEGGYELIYEMDTELFDETGERVMTGNVIPATRANLQVHLFDNPDKSGLPTFFGGIHNTFSYKGIELYALISFSGGNYIYDQAERNGSYVNGVKQYRQSLVDNYWTPNNTDATLPSLSWNNRYDLINEDGSISANQRFDNRRASQVTDRFLYEGDFIRLRSLSLSYNLPRSIVEKMRMQNVRLAFSANNLFTITGYDGYDPEVVVLGGADARNLNQGWVNIQLPQVKTYNFSLNLSF